MYCFERCKPFDIAKAQTLSQKTPRHPGLGNRQISISKTTFNSLSHQQGSNPRPADYKSAALPAELWWRSIFKVADSQPQPSRQTGYSSRQTIVANSEIKKALKFNT